MKFNSNDGFTLVETMVAAAIGAIVLGTFTMVFLNQMSGVVYLEDRMSKLQLENYLIEHFKNPLICHNSFVGTSIKTLPVTVAEVTNHDGTVFLTAGTSPLNFENLKLKSMHLRNDTVPTKPNSTGLMTLALVIERKATGGGPSTFRPIESQFYVETDKLGNITKCDQGDMPCLIPRVIRDPADSTSYTVEPLKVYNHGDIVQTYKLTNIPCGFHCYDTIRVDEVEIRCDNKELTEVSSKLVEKRKGSYHGGPEGPKG